MDKNSTEYFMCHMTQEEFEIGRKGKIKPYEFNLIYQPERSKREDQFCTFCLNPESKLTPETCCTGCGALNSMET